MFLALLKLLNQPRKTRKATKNAAVQCNLQAKKPEQLHFGQQVDAEAITYEFQMQETEERNRLRFDINNSSRAFALEEHPSVKTSVNLQK